MTANVFDSGNLSRNTVIGQALHEIGGNMSAPQQAKLLVGGVVSSGETITVGSKVFEFLEFTTAAGAAGSNQFNNVTNPLVGVTLTAHGGAVGDYIMMGSEFMQVIKVTDANTVGLARGKLGSTIAVHADAVSAFLNDTAPTAGLNHVGLTDGTTVADVVTDSVLSINAISGVGLVAEDVGDNTLGLSAPAKGDGRATTEVTANCSFVNGATMDVGVEKGSAKVSAYTRTIGATEPLPKFTFNFVPQTASVLVIGANGTPKAYDGSYAISGKTVTVDNAGAVDAVSTDIVTVVAYG